MLRPQTATCSSASALSIPTIRKVRPILERYVTQSNVRGLRSIPAQSGRLDDPGVDALWSAAERLGIVVNVLVNRDKRRELESLARRHPTLPVVIDHCLNLNAGREQNDILSDMLALARVPNSARQVVVRRHGKRRAVSFPRHARAVPVRSSTPMARSVASGGATFLASFGVPRPRMRSICASSPTNWDSTPSRSGTSWAKPPGGFIFHIDPFPDIREVLT